MNDTFAAVTSSEILLEPPDFREPSASLGLQRQPLRGRSPATRVLDQEGITRYGASVPWLLSNKLEIHNVVDFWKSQMGIVRSYWFPSWMGDFGPSGGSGTGQSFLDVEDRGFSHVFSLLKDLTNEPYTRPGLTNQWSVMILTANEDRHFRLIDDYSDQGGGIYRMSFVADEGNEALPNNISASEIRLISLMRKSRFTSQEIDLEFATDHVVLTSLGILEVFFE